MNRATFRVLRDWLPEWGRVWFPTLSGSEWQSVGQLLRELVSLPLAPLVFAYHVTALLSATHMREYMACE